MQFTIKEAIGYKRGDNFFDENTNLCLKLSFPFNREEIPNIDLVRLLEKRWMRLPHNTHVKVLLKVPMTPTYLYDSSRILTSFDVMDDFKEWMNDLIYKIRLDPSEFNRVMDICLSENKDYSVLFHIKDNGLWYEFLSIVGDEDKITSEHKRALFKRNAKRDSYLWKFFVTNKDINFKKLHVYLLNIMCDDRTILNNLGNNIFPVFL